MKPTIQLYGQGILLSWKNKISEEIHERVLLYEKELTERLGNKIIESVVAYSSLLLFLKEGVDRHELMGEISEFIPADSNAIHESYCYKIPVCYGGDFGPDLTGLARLKAVKEETLIRMHANERYRIYMTGFLPGFLYLGGLHPELYTPRKSSPTISVAKGSVAIGGEQTGIYPQESPGGWHVIGRTPIDLFSAKKPSPSIFSPGDYLKFEVITRDEFNVIREEVSTGRYNIEKERIA